MGGPSKVYAVKVGKSPGLYYKWEECLEQVKGFKGATFQSFTSLEDAESFLNDEKPARATNSKPTKYYAVRIGKRPGIYTDWPSAQQQVVGWKRPSFKSFPTRSEAQAFLDGNVQVLDQTTRKQALRPTNDDANVERLAKRQKNDNTSDASYLPDSGQNTTGDNVPVISLMSPSSILSSAPTSNQSHGSTLANRILDFPVSGGHIRIYTDGSALGNGKDSAAAGVGVYFGPSDPRNMSEPLGGRQTNQRAELTAVLKAMGAVAMSRSVTIVTDSKYTIECITNWSKAWRRNGWKTKQGKPVENRDLVEEILAKLEQRNANGSTTEFEWIKGHADAPGNVEADHLAVSAARKAAQLLATQTWS